MDAVLFTADELCLRHAFEITDELPHGGADITSTLINDPNRMTDFQLAQRNDLVIFYVLYIFGQIADSVHQHVGMKTTLVRISMAAGSTIRLFAPEEKKQALNEAAAMGEAGESTLSLWLKAMEGEAGLPNAVQDGILR